MKDPKEFETYDEFITYRASEYDKQYKEDNVEKLREYQREYQRAYRIKNIDKIREQQKLNQRKRRAAKKEAGIKEITKSRKHEDIIKELTPEEIPAYLEKKEKRLTRRRENELGIKDATGIQPAGNCESCGNYFEKLTCDHDHKTGVIRGWLCRRCNLGIGALGDTVEGVEKAVIYLKKVYSNGPE